MKIVAFSVAPSIPQNIHFLETLAHNLWWSWNPEAIELFRRIDPLAWKRCMHNPLLYLSSLPQQRLEAVAKDEGFLRHLAEVRTRYETTVVQPAAEIAKSVSSGCIAYFSLEYGIHESFNLYSGGLGVLAADHLKAASDMGLPLVAVGLLYRQGYFQQYLNRDGWQQEHYPENEIHLQPLVRATNRQGEPVFVSIPLPEGELRAAVWRCDVGRVPLYLLDANLPENPPDFRTIAAQLYGGDRRIRLRQELLLGVGGFHALLALGYDPHVCHINEGHAAFLNLARLAHLVKTLGVDLKTAMEIVPRASVFTTHTPVPAGNETFAVDLVRPHFEALRNELGLSSDEVVAWGQTPDPAWGRHEISMTILGLRMSQYCNGVSQLHGRVARRMWKHLWPNKPEDEIPIQHITNGIHVSSWLSPDAAPLFRRYLGPEWLDHPGSPEVLNNVDMIPDEELWRAHELGRARLVRTVREHLERHLRARNATRAELALAKSVLDHESLTIGFARRFATYKRAALLLKDPDRLEALLKNDTRPVQFIFSGKAHPADDHGKDIIRQVTRFAQRAAIQHRCVFLENYDINIARTLVQGADVWLNTPRRPLEASGTSGMKAAVNGGLHLSTLDGWWAEGFTPDGGWAIGDGSEYDDPDYQDAVESQALYNIIENEVIPGFYDRQRGDLPSAWIRMMKASIRMALQRFTSHRMVAEYQGLFYTPAMVQYEELIADGAARARELVKQRERLTALWGNVRVGSPTTDNPTMMFHVGDAFHVTCVVQLGELRHGEVSIQVFHGPVDSHNRIVESRVEEMTMTAALGDGKCHYEHTIRCRRTGRHGFITRAVPGGREWNHIIPGFITWADGA